MSDDMFYVALPSVHQTSDGEMKFVLLPMAFSGKPDETTEIQAGDKRMILLDGFKRTDHKIYTYTTQSSIFRAVCLGMAGRTEVSTVATSKKGPRQLVKQPVKSAKPPSLKMMICMAENLAMSDDLLSMARDNIYGAISEWASETIRIGVFLHEDKISKDFKTRKWPVSAYSPIEWKKLCGHENQANWMIRIGKKILGATDNSDPYNAIDDAQIAELSKSIARPTYIPIGLDTFIAQTNETVDNSKPLAYLGTQYIEWLKENRAGLGCQIEKILVEWSRRALTAGRDIWRAHHVQDPEQVANVGLLSTMRPHVGMIESLLMMGDTRNFMALMCNSLGISQNACIMGESKLIDEMTRISMAKRQYRPMVEAAVSLCMSALVSVESCAQRNTAALNDPYVLNMHVACALPQTNHIGMYVPLCVQPKYLKYTIPFHIPGARIPVRPENIPGRLNESMVAPKSMFEITTDIPWLSMSLAMTGSRYAGACWIGPRERCYPSLLAFIRQYIGTSEDWIADFINVMSVMSQESHGLIDLDYPAIAPISGILREKLTALKGGRLCERQSDIDIAFYGPECNFDDAAAALVTQLRKFGTVFAIRNKKAMPCKPDYSWTIVADFLLFTIDLFHTSVNLVGLLVGYMTSYPRAYFDGKNYICTAEHICSRMSGINVSYRPTMSDPISIMVKCMRREDISIPLNMGERVIFDKWMQMHFPGVPIVYGNVSQEHVFFARESSEEKKYNNDELLWQEDADLPQRMCIWNFTTNYLMRSVLNAPADDLLEPDDQIASAVAEIERAYLPSGDAPRSSSPRPVVLSPVVPAIRPEPFVVVRPALE